MSSSHCAQEKGACEVHGSILYTLTCFVFVSFMGSVCRCLYCSLYMMTSYYRILSSLVNNNKMQCETQAFYSCSVINRPTLNI